MQPTTPPPPHHKNQHPPPHPCNPLTHRHAQPCAPPRRSAAPPLPAQILTATPRPDTPHSPPRNHTPPAHRRATTSPPHAPRRGALGLTPHPPTPPQNFRTLPKQRAQLHTTRRDACCTSRPCHTNRIINLSARYHSPSLTSTPCTVHTLRTPPPPSPAESVTQSAARRSSVCAVRRVWRGQVAWLHAAGCGACGDVGMWGCTQ